MTILAIYDNIYQATPIAGSWENSEKFRSMHTLHDEPKKSPDIKDFLGMV